MIVSLYVLLEALAIVVCLHYLYGEKIRADFKTIAFIIIDLIIMMSIYYFSLNDALSLLIYVFMIIYSGTRFGFRFRPILINNVVCIMLVGLLQSTIMLILFFVANINHIGERESLYINLPMFLITVLGFKKCKLNKISKVLQSNEKIIASALMIMVMAVMFFVISYRHEDGLSTAYYIILIACFVLIALTIVDIGKHKLKAREMEAELHLHKLYEKSFQLLIDDIVAKQHEFDNHMNTLFSHHFLYKTYDELVNAQKEYSREVAKDNKYNKLLTNGNSTILCFLYGKFCEADKKGIEVSYKVNIEDLACGVPVYKIVELMGNLINNAFEEIERKDIIKEIKVVLVECADKVVIEVSNECKEFDYDQVQRFFMKKYSEKGNNRGWGLYNLKRICEEYDIKLASLFEEEKGVKWIKFMLTINKSL